MGVRPTSSVTGHRRHAMRISLCAFSAATLCGCAIENSFLPESGVDTFYQEAVDQVDILFVVDNSASMTEEQAALSAGFASFAQNLEDANSNFHIGVVATSQDSTDPDRGKMIGDTPFLTSADDYITEFQARIALGVQGSDKEKGLEAAAFALSPAIITRHNPGFLRPDANLLVVIVSDEEDCSDDGVLDGFDSAACYNQRGKLVPIPVLVDRLQGVKLNNEFVQIAAIIGPFDESCPDAYSGHRYAEAALLTGGLLGKICDANWDTMLGDLGLNAIGILEAFTLSEPAETESIHVFVDLQTGVPEYEVPTGDVNGWTYDWTYQTLQFHGTAVPPRGSVIRVEYDIAATASVQI
jgi:hypothetical protein